MRPKSVTLGIRLLLCLLCAQVLGGCSQGRDGYKWWDLKTDRSRWFDPSKVVAKPNRATISPILSSASFADQEETLLPNAEPPTAEDFQVRGGDYVLGPTDVVQITVQDLFFEGGGTDRTPLVREISESGMIDLPMLPNRIEAAGLTKEGLRDAISAAYSEDILPDAEVSVAIMSKRNNTFSVIGSGFVATGTFNRPRPEFSLLEALALAGGTPPQQVRYIYVIRMQSDGRAAEAEGDDTAPRRVEPQRDTLPDLPPMVPPAGQLQTGRNWRKAQRELDAFLLGAYGPRHGQLTFSETSTTGVGTRPTTATRPTGGGNGGKWIWSEASQSWVAAPDAPDAPEAAAPDPAAPATPARPDPRPAERPATAPMPPAAPDQPAPAPQPQWPQDQPADDANAQQADPWGWKKAQRGDRARIIAINARQLLQGDQRMNILIRNKDIIHIPPITTGEFYLMGEVARPGVYTLTGREITVKMAVAAGGNLGGLAWPENSVLIRRVDDRQEQIIPLDLEAIFRGHAPDIFIKPDDVIAVGTDWRAPFMAVFRNAFRFTYGFGFIYDRNFGEAAPRGLDSRRFRDW